MAKNSVVIISLESAEKLRNTDEEVSEILNEAGKKTLIYKKKLRNHLIPYHIRRGTYPKRVRGG